MAVQKGEYETAAQLRDQEKAYIEFMITQNGMNCNDHFFYSEGKIYYKTW